MKYCPTCETKYDEEILRFCTKDGTPLIDESQPNFTELPSISAEEEDFGEETLVREKTPPLVVPPPAPDEIVEDTAVEPVEETGQPRIVIPTKQEVRTKKTAYYPPPRPPKSNTALVVVTTILLTLVVLGGIAGLFWALSGDNNAANMNVNTNPPENLNVNVNSNITIPPTNFDYNINSNSNGNFNLNGNFNGSVNTNQKSPTPTRTPTPSPSPSPSASPDANSNSNTRPTPAPTKTPAPSPLITPRTPPPGSPAGSPVSLGVMNGRAVSLPKPAYPTSARAVGANGQVAVQVSVDETGNVTAAKAKTGHPLLRQPAEAAAKQTTFKPILINNQAVKATGVLLYNFINQ